MYMSDLHSLGEAVGLFVKLSIKFSLLMRFYIHLHILDFLLLYFYFPK